MVHPDHAATATATPLISHGYPRRVRAVGPAAAASGVLPRVYGAPC